MINVSDNEDVSSQAQVTESSGQRSLATSPWVGAMSRPTSQSAVMLCRWGV